MVIKVSKLKRRTCDACGGTGLCLSVISDGKGYVAEECYTCDGKGYVEEPVTELVVTKEIGFWSDWDMVKAYARNSKAEHLYNQLSNTQSITEVADTIDSMDEQTAKDVLKKFVYARR